MDVTIKCDLIVSDASDHAGLRSISPPNASIWLPEMCSCVVKNQKSPPYLIDITGFCDGCGGALTNAIDAAETIQAQNSLEKILAHQMAAAHVASMRLFGRAEKELVCTELQGARTRHEAQLSASRLLNSAARLMTSFQDGMATLHKIRCGGRQVVTVQHVQVSDGRQAVVAGTINGPTGGRGTGGGDEN